MTSLTKTVYEFGPFRIDVERYLLLRNDESIPLSPKVFETLLFLVQHTGQAIRKEEIINRIWPDTFVEESNLAQNIFLLRKALGEEKNEHRKHCDASRRRLSLCRSGQRTPGIRRD